MRAAGAVMLLWLSAASRLSAQRLERLHTALGTSSAAAWRAESRPPESSFVLGESLRSPGRDAARATWWAPVASAAVPGSGQALLSQQRFFAYVAVEGFAWLQYATDRREGQRQRRAYRVLARSVARAYYPGDKPDGDFAYYERMEHFTESGVYDQVPGGVIDPETDEATFNGATWLLARQTYWPDPTVPPSPAAYDSALKFYQSRAIPPAFRWSWRNAQLEQDVFRRTIDRSNDAFRRSIEDLGVVLANHVLSMIDGYVTVRLRRRAGGGGGGGDGSELSATLPLPGRARLRSRPTVPPR